MVLLAMAALSKKPDIAKELEVKFVVVAQAESPPTRATS
jgi:hypothetical protein